MRHVVAPLPLCTEPSTDEFSLPRKTLTQSHARLVAAKPIAALSMEELCDRVCAGGRCVRAAQLTFSRGAAADEFADNQEHTNTHT